jgi:hypothetical protein
MIETSVRNALLVSALVLGLVVAFPAVSLGGSTFVNVGGELRVYESSSPTSNKIRERSQHVGSASPEYSNRLIDRTQTGSSKSADKAATGSGGSGEYSKPGGGTGEYGRPTSPFCSSTNITIGEEHHTTLHCPGGTIR